MGSVPASSVEAVAAPPSRPASPPSRQWSAFVSLGAAFAVIFGLLGLAGWVFDFAILKSGWPELVQIKANTAICLILLGVSLWLQRKATEQTRARNLAGQLLAGLAAAVGLVSYGEYLFGWDLGIDQLLFADSQQEAVRSVALGLMAPVNALSFYFLGLALIVLSWAPRREVWPSQILSFAAGLISLFNLMDFIVAPGSLHTYTSLPAAIALTVLSPAVMSARPQWGYGAAAPGSSTREPMARRWFFRSLTDSDRPLRYGGAVLLAAAAVVLNAALHRSLGGGSIYVVFYPVTLLAAMLGGLKPGILATLLSAAAAAYFFLDPPGMGVEKPGDMLSLAVFSATGIGIAVLAEVVDRARRRSADKLGKSYAYARSLIETGLDPLLVISREGKITDVNHATEEATGVARARLIGRDFSGYFTDPEKAREGYRQAFDQGQLNDYPLALRHVSGKVMDVLYHARVYRDETGAVAGVFAAARDITERKRVEQELSVYRQHLEELVAARTAEIQTSNKSLASANQELETFAYSVSHDLRTPLRAVDGFSRILLEEYAPQLDAEGRRIIGVIRDGTKRMARMIDDILAFSGAGRMEISLHAIDMGELVRAALKDLGPAMAGRDVRVEIKPLPPAHGDAPMFRLLWTNLLDNALKFTRPKLKGVIEVGAQAGKGEMVYYVKDNGVGFDMRYVDKLFGVFQRLHGQSEFPGTGIGLAIVKRIVARHGGRVWAKGKVGEGATVYFALPAGDKS